MPANGADSGAEPRRRRPPGIYDVARAAGVSHQTVSRVLNDHPSVRPETRARIQAAIESLGYRRNIVARALATQKSGMIGVVTTRDELYGPTSVLLNVEAAAREMGYYVSLVSLALPDEQDMRGAVDHFLDQQVEGLVVIGKSAEFVEAFIKAGVRIPAVTVSALVSPPLGVYVVTVDHYAGARLAVQHLLDLGHTDIAHLSGPPESLDSRSRVRAWRDCLFEAGLRADRLVTADWTAAAGYSAGRQLIEDGLPGAVFAGNDEMALGLLRALSEHGVRVPTEISVVGFDDIPGSGFFNPPLTTVRQEFGNLGRRCVTMLLAAIAGESPESPTLVMPKLLVRGTTRALHRSRPHDAQSGDIGDSNGRSPLS